MLMVAQWQKACGQRRWRRNCCARYRTRCWALPHMGYPRWPKRYQLAPHVVAGGKLAVVHNGIIENSLSWASMQDKGYHLSPIRTLKLHAVLADLFEQTGELTCCA